MKTTIYLFLICYLFIFIGCKKHTNDVEINENVIRVIGTNISSDADKEKWSDFQLVLEIKKDNYFYKEPILTNLYFKNIGKKPISLKLVVQETQFNAPPIINIWTKDERKYNVTQVVANLADSINVEPNESIELMQFDLTNVGGTIFRKDTIGDWYIGYVGYESPNIGPDIIKGTYFMCASFIPLPHIYGSTTDTLSFEIK